MSFIIFLMIFTCCVWRSQMILLIVERISSINGTNSPVCGVTKCRLHFSAIFMNVSQAISCTPS